MQRSVVKLFLSNRYLRKLNPYISGSLKMPKGVVPKGIVSRAQRLGQTIPYDYFESEVAALVAALEAAP